MKRIIHGLIVLLVFLLTTDCVFAQSSPANFIIRGTGYNRMNNRYLSIGDQLIYNATARGLRLTVIRKSDLAIGSDQVFDTFMSSEASDALAVALNSIDNLHYGILTSFDAWEQNVSPDLDQAFYRLGLIKAGATINSGSRKPYAAIFEGASGGAKSTKAVEVSFTNSAAQPFAEIRGYFHSGSFVATGNQPSGLVRPQGESIEVLVDHSGNVGIGTLTPSDQYKLSVNGAIRAKEIKVETDWADFVFEEDYYLRPLKEVKEYIELHKHLPEIPSAKTIKEEGANLGVINSKLLQKIEELTLYLIDQENRTDSLIREINDLRNENKLLRDAIKELK